MFKKLVLIFLVLTSATILLLVKKDTKEKVVAINQFVNHPALDKAVEGIEMTLKDYKPKLRIQVQNAQGSIAVAVQIASHQASENPDVLIGIATPSAQANIKARKDDKILLAFVAVTDPVAAGMTKTENIIGVSDTPPIQELVELLIKTMPKRKRIGIIFNPSEVNSVKMVGEFTNIAKSQELSVITSPVHSSSNVKLAAQKLIGEVDVIFLPQDNLVVSAIDSIVQMTLTEKIPLIGNDPSLVSKGLLFALGCDYFTSGKQLGEMIIASLEGKTIEPRIQFSNVKELKVNEKVAITLGIDIEQLQGERK